MKLKAKTDKVQRFYSKTYASVKKINPVFVVKKKGNGVSYDLPTRIFCTLPKSALKWK
ncbi:hypothetical protein RG963_09915 [Methanosarcina sp. Z-7115]|uniref:Uncharacterized protein n=1 Tax=Methanosarcina baikalica TaxID=3073890 RepID=A0ABU2D280_9EURY|nr:hypothetical protein [Methanosarcina sp. Z-7115]MDR7666084.1 hypothetical protein [Methanosarcina sp. Z-7115]